MRAHIPDGNPPKTLTAEGCAVIESFPARESGSLSDFLKEFENPSGRFKSPFSIADLLKLRVAQRLARFDIFKAIDVLPRYTIPANWQVLLNYLYRRGVITAPHFRSHLSLPYLPSIKGIWLESPFDKDKTDGMNTHSSGHRSSLDLEESFSKCIGETLERYFLTLYKTSSFRKSSYNELARSGTHKAILHPQSLNTFLPRQKQQFSRFNYSDDMALFWVEGLELLSNKKAYIPAQLIFWNYQFEAFPQEPILGHPTTNGAAGHFSPEETVLSGLYELVQRDGFLIFWLNSLSPPVINVHDVDDYRLKRLLRLFERYEGLDVIFLDTTSDIAIPSCTCVLLDTRGEPRLSVAASTGFDPIENLVSSALESLRVLQFTMSAQDPCILPAEYIPFTNQPVIGKTERLMIWQSQEMLDKFHFFISGPQVPFSETRFARFSRDFQFKKDEWHHVRALFEAKGEGYEIYCHFVHDATLRSLEYHVAKIVVPRLFPLFLQEHMATLDSVRLHDVPGILGYSESHRNPWPHPFS